MNIPLLKEKLIKEMKKVAIFQWLHIYLLDIPHISKKPCHLGANISKRISQNILGVNSLWLQFEAHICYVALSYFFGFTF